MSSRPTTPFPAPPALPTTSSSPTRVPPSTPATEAQTTEEEYLKWGIPLPVVSKAAQGHWILDARNGSHPLIKPLRLVELEQEQIQQMDLFMDHTTRELEQQDQAGDAGAFGLVEFEGAKWGRVVRGSMNEIAMEGDDNKTGAGSDGVGPILTGPTCYFCHSRLDDIITILNRNILRFLPAFHLLLLAEFPNSYATQETSSASSSRTTSPRKKPKLTTEASSDPSPFSINPFDTSSSLAASALDNSSPSSWKNPESFIPSIVPSVGNPNLPCAVGDSIGTEHKAGTFCLWLKKADGSPGVYGMTAGHLFKEYYDARNRVVYQPALPDLKHFCAEERHTDVQYREFSKSLSYGELVIVEQSIVNFEAGKPEKAHLDVAVFKITRPSNSWNTFASSPEHQYFNPAKWTQSSLPQNFGSPLRISKVGHIIGSQDVSLRGRSSGNTKGLLASVKYTKVHFDHDIPGQWCNEWGVCETRGEPFSRSGDSGAVILAGEDFESPVGMMLAGIQHLSYVTSIKWVLQKLQQKGHDFVLMERAPSG